VKRTVPLLITMLSGMFVLLGFFVREPHVRGVYDDIQQYVIVVVAFTYVLGVANVLHHNLEGVRRRSPDWIYKVVLLAGLALNMVVGFSEGSHYLDDASGFSWIYQTFYTPMAATMFALLAFFIASAAFRAFRVRTTEALLLAIAAIILMLGRVPIGNAIHPWIPDTANWLMEIPQNAAKRGILMGAALGVVATGLRVIFGVEKTYGGGSGGGG
jgi:hypothetical protein